MNSFFDSHSHLQDPAFQEGPDEAIRRAVEAGVVGIAVLGYDLASSHIALELGAAHPSLVYPAVGIHPHDASRCSSDDLAQIAALATRDEVVAVGETGLDFYRNLSGAEEQQTLLQFHLDLSLETGKPVSIHSRSAEDAILAPLQSFSSRWSERWPDRTPGVMHCFGGLAEQALGFVDLGFMVSVACVVTYPSADSTRAVARAVPLESLLIETDSPYLPPQTSRGKRNEPAFVAAGGAGVAVARGISVAEVAQATTANAERLFRVKSRRQAPAVSP